MKEGLLGRNRGTPPYSTCHCARQVTPCCCDLQMQVFHTPVLPRPPSFAAVTRMLHDRGKCQRTWTDRPASCRLNMTHSLDWGTPLETLDGFSCIVHSVHPANCPPAQLGHVTCPPAKATRSVLSWCGQPDLGKPTALHSSRVTSAAHHGIDSSYIDSARER